MKVTEHIARAKKTLFSFEILPPLRGHSILDIFNALDPLMEFNPPFVDVTYHREEFVYKVCREEFLQKKRLSRRPGTVAICAAIMNKYGVDAVPHLLCGGFNKQMTEDALIDLHFLGVSNVLVLRGDPIKSEKKFTPEKGGHRYALDLVKQIVSLNQGIYLDEDFNGEQLSDFCVGIAGYPEKHFEAPNREEDLFHLAAKVAAGADYVVTQMFFDNAKYFDFTTRCKAEGLDIPIIPGIKPISSKAQLCSIPANFHVDIPHELVRQVQKAKDDESVYRIGIEWAIQQSMELKQAGVPLIHYYTMSKPHNVYEVVKALF